MTLLALSVAVAAFPGGAPADLARHLSESMRAPVFVAAGPREQLPRFEYEPSDLNAMADAVFKSAKLRRAPGTDHAFFHPRLPSWHFEIPTLRKILGPDGQRAGADLGAVAQVADGKVTLQHGSGEGMLAKSLERLALSKPLLVDAFFDKQGLSIWASAMPERDFLEHAAKALGGYLKVTREGYFLEPSGQETARRALAAFDEARRSPAYAKLAAVERAELELSQAVLASTPYARLSGLLLQEGQPVKVEIGPAVRTAVVAWIRAIAQAETPEKQGFGPPAQQEEARNTAASPPANRFANLDRRVLGYVYLHKGFRVAAELATVDQLGRPGPPLRLP
jgi:hypothetical protein